jgi:CRP/FNR family transcriptional regulator, cyclic AMP receptor protein
MIPAKILEDFGAIQKKLRKGDILFQEGESATFYYQIDKGEVKMLNWSDEGREFIQGIFGEGQSFGEPALFGGFPYPASVVATQDAVLYQLPFRRLLDLLQTHFDIHLQFTQVLSKRLQYKSMILKEISSNDAEHQIMTLIKYLKKESNTKGIYEVKLTRQNIADMTGLRVETVIRTIKTMVEQRKLTQQGRKIGY